MGSSRLGFAFWLVLLLTLTHAVCSAGCPFGPIESTRITNAIGQSRTARDNARCICCDAGGTVHMVWEDKRTGNFEIYYAALAGDSVKEVRISRSRGESSYPCVACDSSNVYILWQEETGRVFDIYYARLSKGEVVARKRILSTNLDSSCPVSAMGPDGNLHFAWHEGPYKQTAIYHGMIAADSLVVKEAVCSNHPLAFRPDIAWDERGNMLIVWFEGVDLKSRLWDGKTWGEETYVATTEQRAWRLSVTALSDGNWAAAWFDNTGEGSDVSVKFYDGTEWTDETMISEDRHAYYPGLTGLEDGSLVVVWEEKNLRTEIWSIMLRCYRSGTWGPAMEIYRERAAGRYPSLATHEGNLHAVWFSAKQGNDEIFHGLLRRK
jgi:hypothetical protein